MLTPIFKCITNPRTVTAHNWNTVDVIGSLASPTECFYSKDGKWYYAGTYQAVKLQDLIPEEWSNLSNEVGCCFLLQYLMTEVPPGYAIDRQGDTRRTQEPLSSEQLRDQSTLRCRCIESSMRWVTVRWVQ